MILNNTFLKDDAIKVKVYTNFEKGGFVYGNEDMMVDHITLAEDQEGNYH